MPKKYLFLAIKIAITVGMLGLVLRTIDFDSAVQRLAQADLALLLLASLAVAFQGIIVVSLRWSRVLAVIDSSPPLPQILHMTTISIFFNQILPSTVGGDGIRMWLLTRLDRPVGIAVRSVLMDRIFGLFAMLILACIGAAYLLQSDPSPAPMWIVLAIGVTGLLCLVASPILGALLTWLPSQRLRQTIDAIAVEVRAIAKDRLGLSYMILLSVVGQLSVCLAVWALARSLDIDTGLLAVAAVLPGVFLISTVPLSIAGWGLREGAMVIGLAQIGVAAGDAALVSVFYGLLLLALGLIGGLAWLLSGSLRASRREHEAQDMAG